MVDEQIPLAINFAKNLFGFGRLLSFRSKNWPTHMPRAFSLSSSSSTKKQMNCPRAQFTVMVPETASCHSPPHFAFSFGLLAPLAGLSLSRHGVSHGPFMPSSLAQSPFPYPPLPPDLLAIVLFLHPIWLGGGCSSFRLVTFASKVFRPSCLLIWCHPSYRSLT